MKCASITINFQLWKTKHKRSNNKKLHKQSCSYGSSSSCCGTSITSIESTMYLPLLSLSVMHPDSYQDLVPFN